METIAFENCYMCYLENNPYKYPSIDVETMIEGTTLESEFINTGWHIVPNFLWRHVVTPGQWTSLMMGCEAYKVKSISGTMYNPIPITTSLAIQRTNEFSAFNNCTYALTYTDNKYETQWFKWYDLARRDQLHLALKEGMIWEGTQQGDAAQNYTAKRYLWPIYSWQRPNMRTIIDNVWSQGKIGGAGVYDVDTQIDSTAILRHTRACPGGVFWDPFNCPDEIGELRAGKNAIGFSWTPHKIDEDKMFNLDALASFGQWTTDGPFCGVGRPGTWRRTTNMDPDTATTFGLAQKQPTSNSGVTSYDDYTIPNMAFLPIVPTKWFWKEIENSIIDTGEENVGPSSTHTQFKAWRKADKYYAGTEWEAYKYPVCQWFTKGIPLFDRQNTLIKTTTQISFKIKIVIEGKKRRSAYYAPTYGPISGDQIYYHTNKRAIMQPACIRYRTGGGRRTWQNIQALWEAGTDTNNTNHNISNFKAHPRLDIYKWDAGTTNPTTQEAMFYTNQHRPAGIPDGQRVHGKQGPGTNIRVTWHRDTDTAEITMEDDE